MGKRGPKPYAPTAQQRADVKLFRAGGMSKDGIAAALKITRVTLDKHFADELESGGQQEMAANLRRLRKAAEEGNVTAMKHLDAKFGAAAAEQAFTEPAGASTPRLGKKEEAAAAAQTAGDGTEWGNDLKIPTTNTTVN